MDNEQLRDFGLANQECKKCTHYETGNCGGSAITCEEYEEIEE